MSQNPSISLSITAQDLKPWIPRLAELYYTLNVHLGFDVYLSVLLNRPRSADDFTALLENIALHPESFHELTQNGGYPPAGGWVTILQIAGEVGRSGSWVSDRLTKYFSGMMKIRCSAHNNNPVPHYPPSVIPRLQEMVREYPPAGKWVTGEQIAEQIKKSRTWVSVRLDEHFPGVGELRLARGNSQPRLHYPPSVVPKLKELAKEYLLADGWVTILQISRLLGKSQSWVRNQLSEHFPDVGEVRLVSPNNQPYLHYPPSVVPKLKQLATEYPLDGEWVTVKRIAWLVQRDYGLVCRRLAEHFPGVGELRLARGNSQPRLHYPPSVIPKLKELAQEYLPAGEWVTVKRIAREIGKSRSWVFSKLAENFPGVGELRLVRGDSQPRLHYPPSVVPKLKELAKEYLLADGWVTIPQIAGEVWRSGPWVVRKLAEHFPGVGELRLMPYNSRPELHYPPSVVPKLKRLATEYPPAGEWLTTSDIAGIVKRAKSWVKSRLAEHFPGFGELRLARGNNNPDLHYPPSVVPKLKQLATQHPLAGRWLTAADIAGVVKKGRHWVIRRLAEHFPGVGELRLNRVNNKLDLHYPPSVVNKLRKLL